MTEHKTRWQATRRNGCDLFMIRGGVRNLPLRLLPLWPTGRHLKAEGEFAPAIEATVDTSTGDPA